MAGSPTYFTVTHPFHPLRGRRYELVKLDRRWWRWRTFYLDEDGTLGVFPASWTDAGPLDSFVEQSARRAIARGQDLLQLADMVQEIQERAVNENKPHV